jgi:hypothetical protein
VRLNAVLEAKAAELEHLEGPAARLNALVTGAQEVARRQAALKASKQEASRELEAMLISAQRVATAIQKLLIEHYGLRSEKLAEFDLQPFRGRRWLARPEPPGPEPEPGPPGPLPE